MFSEHVNKGAFGEIAEAEENGWLWRLKKSTSNPFLPCRKMWNSRQNIKSGWEENLRMVQAAGAQELIIFSTFASSPTSSLSCQTYCFSVNSYSKMVNDISLDG